MWCFCKALQLCKGNRTRMGLDLRGQCWDWAAEVFKTQCAFRSSWSTKLVWHWASKRFVLAYGSDNEQRLVLIFTKTCLCCCLWRAFPKVLFFSLAAPKTFLPVTQMLSFCFMLSCYEADALVFFFVPISSVSHWWNSIPLRQLWESSKMVEELSSSVALGPMTVMHCHWLLRALCM